MLADAAVGTIVTGHDLADIVDPALGAPSLYVDAASSYSTASLPTMPVSNGGDSAYVIYTSGSTGQPKGVEILHRSLLNCLLATQELIGFAASDSLLAITTPSFDISTVELFMPLVVGGVLHLGEDDLQADGIRLAQRIDDCKPSYLQATPSTWKMILAAGWQGDRHLRMGVTGEAVSRDLAEQLLSKGQALWNSLRTDGDDGLRDGLSDQIRAGPADADWPAAVQYPALYTGRAASTGTARRGR